MAPCEWPVAPTWVVSMRWYSTLRRVVVLFQHPGHSHHHRCRISLGDVRAIGPDHDEPVRREMPEEHAVHARGRAGAVAPGDDGMAEPALRQIRRPEQGELRRRAPIGADAGRRTDVVLGHGGERSRHRRIGCRPRTHGAPVGIAADCARPWRAAIAAGALAARAHAAARIAAGRLPPLGLAGPTGRIAATRDWWSRQSRLLCRATSPRCPTDWWGSLPLHAVAKTATAIASRDESQDESSSLFSTARGGHRALIPRSIPKQSLRTRMIAAKGRREGVTILSPVGRATSGRQELPR